MMTKKIYARDNVFQHIQTLQTNRKKRFSAGEFVVEGVRNINEAVKNGWEIRSFLYPSGHLSDWAQDLITNVKTEINYQFTPELMQELSKKEDTSELMAVIGMRTLRAEEIRLTDNPFMVLFDRPSNKGNLGTMIRSCDSLGVDLLILTGHGVDLYDPDVVSASMGSFFNLPVVYMQDEKELDRLTERVREKCGRFTMFGTTAHKQNPIYKVDLTGPLMLMIGNETMGLSKAYKEKCDILCTIPMAETSYASSFNVSCAASIMMYEVTRQRFVSGENEA